MSPIMKRCSGILCHITSLPSCGGIGSLGPESVAFLDFLVEANQSLWQMLPVGPVDVALGGSPYCGVSSFAGNELLVGLEALPGMGLLEPGETGGDWASPDEPVDWSLASSRKGAALDRAWEAFSELPSNCGLLVEFENFRDRNRAWLDDYSSFQALKSSREEKPGPNGLHPSGGGNRKPCGKRLPRWNPKRGGSNSASGFSSGNGKNSARKQGKEVSPFSVTCRFTWAWTARTSGAGRRGSTSTRTAGP